MKIHYTIKQYANRLNVAMLAVTSLLLTAAQPSALAGVYPSPNGPDVVARAALPAILTQNYTFQTVDAPDKDLSTGEQYTWVNNSGLIAQQYFGPDAPVGFGHTAVLWDGVWTVIDVPGSVTTGGTNPNAQGQIALTYAGDDLIYHLAIWQRGQYTFVPDPAGYLLGAANGINERGQVSGLVYDSDGIGLGFVGDQFHYKIFAYPGSDVVLTIAFQTNNSGITVGLYMLAGEPGPLHSFLYDGTHFTNIDIPGAILTSANAINNKGEIAGYYMNLDDAAPLGFLLYQGKYTDITVPDTLASGLYMITDSGKIAGTYLARDGGFHGFVATPVSGK